ncbi:hypothetical protein OC844_002351 [Tilletia horrida]|nr:hypothetical protein OC844_002351 [Tilletia horrida]
MASLDYGAPDELELEDRRAALGGGTDAGNNDDEFDADAAMEGIVNNPEVSLDELYEAQAQSAHNKVPARFYEYPAQEGIAAGGRRAIQPLGLNPAALEPVFPHELKKGDDQLFPAHDNDASHLAVPEITYSRTTGAPNLRLSALHIGGIPITQLSTSRLFAYVTYFGAQPLGLEWIDDERAIIVFAEPEAARLAFEYLCPPGAGRFRRKKKKVAGAQGDGDGEVARVKQEGAEQGAAEAAQTKEAEMDGVEDGDDDMPQEIAAGGVLTSAELTELMQHLDAQTGAAAAEIDMEDEPSVDPQTIDDAVLARLLTPRTAHRLPLSLYTGPEREALSAVQQAVGAGEFGAGGDAPLTMLDAEGNRVPIPADAPAIYREMAEQERQSSIMTPEARKLLALRGKLHVRFALDGRPDTKERGARKKSKWFSDHGIDAGREVVPRLLAVGPRGMKDEEDPFGRVKEELFPDRAAPPSLARPDAWEDDRADGARGRGRGSTRAVMDDLDAELDSYSSARRDRDDDGADADGDGRRRSGRDADRWVNDRADEVDRPASRIGYVAQGGGSGGNSLFERLGGAGGGSRRRRGGGGGGADRERSPTRRDRFDEFGNGETDEFGRERRRKRDYAGGEGGGNVKGRGSVRAALAWDDVDDKRPLQSRLATLGERMGGTGEDGRKLLDRFGGAGADEGGPAGSS